jgi:hypothetical protein
MFRKSLIAAIVVAVLVMLTASIASAEIIYSENFDGATVGQSVTASPIDWLSVILAGSDILVGEGAHGWTSKYLDAATVRLGDENLFQKQITLPTTGTVKLSFKAYVPTGDHPVTGLVSDPNDAGLGFSVGAWSNGPRWWLSGSGWYFSYTWWQVTETFTTPYDVDTALEIYLDYDNGKTWGVLKWGEETRTTGHYALTYGIDSISGLWDGRSSGNGAMTRRGFDCDDIEVATLEAPGDVAGTIALADYTGDITRVPIYAEIMNESGPVGSAVVHLPEDGTFQISNVQSGDYTIVFSACKSLNVAVPVTVTPGGVTDIGTITMPNGDLNGDNSVGFADFNILRKNWGMEGD